MRFTLRSTIRSIWGLAIGIILLSATARADDGQIDIASLPYTISKSGSYIVVANLELDTTGDHGITIEVDHVTLDLHGHVLTGPGKEAGTTDHGILLSGARVDIEIRNGTIREWPADGIHGDLAGNNTQHSRFLNLRCFENGDDGIDVNSRNLFRGNTCTNNGGNGIEASFGCTVANNMASNNGSAGISTNDASTITGNTCVQNGGNGISTAARCLIIGNTCSANGATGISVASGSTIINNNCSDNDGRGILGSDYSTMINNTCYSNGDDGILAGFRCTIKGNTCVSNGSTVADGAGIQVTGSGNNIVGNTCATNDIGLDIDNVANYSSLNVLTGNDTDEDIGGSIEGGGEHANIVL